MNRARFHIQKHPIQNGRKRTGVRSRALLLPVAWFATFSGAAHAFVAAGDRVFPGTLILPQIAPTDEAYIQGATPFGGTAPVPSNVSRRTDAIWFFGKTLTERLGI